MANGCERDAGLLFTDEELSEISGMRRGVNFVEVMCGCTSHRYGDAVGKLRVFASGDLEIDCECTPGCQEEKLTPAAFEKHSGRETTRKWKSNVWLIVKGEKVSLSKTPLLKYYNQASKGSNGCHKGPNGRPCHRDEFIRCTKCNKERRFRLHNKEDCRNYHDALTDLNWSCSDFPTDKISCDDEEERASRKVLRGCFRSPSCRGCTSCVCFGCETCRFKNCNCQTCVDFTRNAET
ncbi:Protein ultrapetala 1 [Apostasia shenzhenica]|uniref:Protein ultrapetala 1 n=1 Tax=Apostasia shenzhenica TaxID=1088818 RepID=A0A2H9ZX70_9ASPA|nr:Protein ultrapetala 1 [Apostasia shenzhenica]